MINRCDILIPIFFFYGRDAEVIILVKYYLETTYKLHVRICSVFDPFIIDLINPKIVLMENVVGSTFHVDFARYVYERGYPLISLLSEGFFNERSIMACFWGSSKEQKIFFDKLFVWTPFLRELIIKHFPKAVTKSNILISGAIGFDRYKICKFTEKKIFLKKYNKEKYKFIVGYAGTVFSYFCNPKNYRELTYDLGKREPSFYNKEKDLVQQTIEQVISGNKEILFILKKNPSEDADNMDICNRWIQQYDNIVILQNEEPISDLINVCDVWSAYDSTTCLEAWMLKKPTIVLMPSPNYENRTNAYKGSIIARDDMQFSSAIKSYMKKGFLKEFDEKSLIRKKIILQTIYKEDGLNSKRTSTQISKLFVKLTQSSNRASISARIVYFFQHIFLLVSSKFRWLPLLNKSSIVKWYSEYPEFEKLEKIRKPQIEKFSIQHGNL